MEIWKDIKGFEGLYQVSNLGRVKSLDVIQNLKHSSGTEYTRFKKGRILRPEQSGRVAPYVIYYLKKDGKRHFGKAHRLVAKAFIPNPENKKVVNHLDCNPKNNNVSNLEWATHSENIKYAYDKGRIDIAKCVDASLKNRYKLNKPVLQYDMNGLFIKRHKSISDAAIEIGSDVSSISKVCRGKYNHVKNYKFQYEQLLY